MSVSGQEHATPSVMGGDGVRIVREHRSRLSPATALMMLAAVAIVAGIAGLLFSSQTPPAQRRATAPAGVGGTAPAGAASVQAQPAAPLRPSAAAVRTPQRHASLQNLPVATDPISDNQPSGDPDDLATYLSPTEPAPTMTEVIQALHDSGDHTGIGAFNPPGTSPPLVGLAVPADFELPPGYVRHHQVTDEGEPLEPILMFSPDGVFVDASGRQITIPDDRVVPASMAPPGMAIREITMPTAAERRP